jgi:chloramphenicol-sensitive protein RarD
MLVMAGLVTSIPLVLFAYAAKRLRFGTLGFIQYLSPSLKFICGLFIFHEPLSSTKLQAFLIIWIALAWYTAESFYNLKSIKKSTN